MMKWRSLSALLCVPLLTGLCNGCLAPGGDYKFRLRLTETLVSVKRGQARIPCAFTAPMRALSGRQVWFRGSPEFPLSPAEAHKMSGLMGPRISTESECSVVLWDARETPEEYGFMLEWGANERHVFPDRVKVVSCVAKVELTPSTYAKDLLAGEETVFKCSLSNHCPGIDPKITWKGLSSTQVIQQSKKEMLENSGYSEQLLYVPLPEDHQAEITCEATFGKNLSASAKTMLTVHSHPQILNSSACSLQQDQLTCVCVSQGVPLPDIHWPLLPSKHYFTKARASHITVRSTFTMTVVKFTSNSTVTCVSRNYLGQTNMTLPVNITEG
ncbi:sialic acid-binding Ig-like lectin 12 isoform X2 [Puntigrus tetrazona]|nr:sialic acid-binding Ig-like lectin 12 isoform X2 [Puntigrus tetrazona]